MRRHPVRDLFLYVLIGSAVGAWNTVYDPGSGRILVAVHGKNELVAIDPATAKIADGIQ